MPHIVTVLGEIPTEQLGHCQPHEHIWLAKGYSATINPVLCIDDIASSTRELELYHKAGGRAIVDAQPLGSGRDAVVLEELSRKSGVHIIASTGFHKMLFYKSDHWLYTLNTKQLTQLFTQELTNGMYTCCDTQEPSQRTSFRAGQIKTALDSGEFTGQYQKLFHGAADAAIITGAPIMVHIEAGSNPVKLADFFYDKGVLPQRLIFCHMDRSVADIGIHKELCQRGIYLEYDTIARPRCHDDYEEIKIISQMLDAGWHERILLSLDVTRARLESYGGNVGLSYILTTFLPRLKQSGVTKEQIEDMLVHNPATAFSYK